MRYKEFLKKAKRFLAFALALTLFLGGWSNYDFSVRATETENAGNGPEDTEPVEDAEDDGSEETPAEEETSTGEENLTDEKTPDTESGNNEENNTPAQKKDPAGTDQSSSGETSGSGEPTDEETPGNTSPSGTTTPGGTSSEDNSEAGGTEDDGSIKTPSTGTQPTKVPPMKVQAGANSIEGVPSLLKADDTLHVQLSPESGIYTGSDLTPEITVYANEDRTTPLKEDTDYTITWKNENNEEVNELKEVGTYTCIITGRGEYESAAIDPSPVNFKIDYASFENAYTVEGDGFQEGYYRSDVTVNTADNYTISTALDDNFSRSVEFSDSQSNTSIYIKNADGQITKETLTFTIDKEAPQNLSAEIEQSTVDSWTKSKSVTISVTDANVYGNYYSTTDIELSGVNSLSDLDECTEISGNSFEITEEIGTEPKTYYIYAVDEAGNIAETQISVSKIDKEPPTVKGIEDGTEYYKNSNDKTITFQVSDAASGIKDVISSDGINAIIVADPNTVGNYTVTFKAAGSYKITATDIAENSSEINVTVAQDTITPKITLDSVKNDAGMTAKDSNEQYYFANSLSVTFIIGEKTAPSGEKSSPIIIRRNNEIFQENVTLGTVTDQLSNEGTYTYSIEDAAGNIYDQTIEIKAVQSNDEPTIEISYPEEAVTVGEDTYFNANTVPDILGNISTDVGIAKIEFRGPEESSYRTLVDYENKSNGTYSVIDHTSFNGSLKSNDDFKDDLMEELTDAADGTYQYIFKVTNTVGNTATVTATFKIDKTAPSSDIFVSYDTDGTNSTQQGDTGVIGFISNQIDKLFGKETIGFSLYVKDEVPANDTAVSGINTDDLLDQIVPTNGTLKLVDVREGSTATFEVGEKTYSGYTHITGTIELDETEYGSDQIKINQITDRAGNVLNQINATDITGTTVIYLDSVPPELDVDYSSDAVIDDDNDRIYYQNDAVIGLSLEEAYYEVQTGNDGNPVAPVVAINNVNEDAAWSKVEDSIFNSAIELSGKDNTETSYTFSVQYQDGSGNTLIKKEEGNAKGEITGDTFINNEIVVDKLAPILTSFQITGTTNYSIDGVPVYVNNTSGDDITIGFSVDDHKDYWNPAGLKFKIYNVSESKTVVELTGSDLTWESSGRIHSTSYSFDGEVDIEANYQVQITYSDRAGNKMVDGRTDSTGEELSGEMDTTTGTYTSPEFILDHKSPKINVTYNDAYRVIDGEGADVGLGIHPKTGQTAYYGSKDSNGNSEGKIEVTVQITDKYLKTKKVDEQSEDITLEDINVIAEKTETGKSGSSTTIINVTDLKWEKDGTTYTSRFTIDSSNTSKWGDGDYKVKVLFQESDRTERAYTDAAGNEMSESDTIQGGRVDGGKYTSTTLILDTEAPKLERSYTAAPVNSYNGRDYYNSQTNLVITVGDQNIRYKELKNALLDMKAFDINGTDLKESTAAWSEIQALDENRTSRGSWTATIPLTTEANYRIPISYVDLAGNAAVLNTVDQVTVDTTTPADLEFDYSINDPVNYGLFGWLFAQTKMTVRATAKDGTAGLQYIRFTVVDENKKETVRTGEFEPRADGSYSVEIPLESADFKGTVKAEVYDYSNNQIEQTRNHVVESGGKHSSTGSAVITTRTSPSRTVDGEDFYNTDVTFNLTLKDDYSGLRSYTYTGGSTLSGSRNYAEEAGTVLGEGGPEVTYEFSQDMTLAAAQNNENEVKVSAEFVDNAGHTGQVEQLYNIDVTDPEITVEWDLNDPANELYYNQTRTATVTIRERNFDADDVEFTVTNTDGAMPTFGGWSSSGSGDNTEHVCQVTFDQDGDYTFTLSFQDKAGNEASYDRVDEFTIDKTFPELTVTWNNNNSQNEFYYAESRTATIDILEHNFDPNLIDVVTTADGASAPNVSGWSRNGDHNVATVTFSADADYTFDIEGMDLAENALDEYEQEQFTVDQTAPELEIFDIENMSANNGIVMPGVRYSDTNYDPDATVIAMTGYHNGPVEMNGTRTAAANGMEIKLNDFEHVPEMDDMYTMEATVYDLAGNSSEASVIFSVNRFGSVYTFSDATDALVGDNGKYYTNEEQEIVVTETNVDTLEFREITKNLNGSLNTMAEGEEYTVSESGTDVSWKQYTYTIPKENFEEEGTYILTIYSEDRAANTSDNNTKGKQIEFVVDKTSPSILVSGVENDGQYRENSRPVTLDVQDNIRLAEVQVQIDGEETVYTAEEIVEADGKLTLTAGSANHWQEMSVTARDAAGNEETAETIRFLITSNIFVQFFMNKPLFYGTLIALAAAAAGGWRLWIVLKKRKDKEEQQ